MASFAVARTFTMLYPQVVLIRGGLHIHHFWYGLAMLTLGGWLGISYENERVNQVAAIIFGAGGGLVGDEVGLLLTFRDYQTGITYTFLIAFLVFASMLILLNRYSKIIRLKFTQILRRHAALYFGVFLAAVSIAFILETENTLVIAVSTVLTLSACIIILVYFIQRIRKKA